MFDLTCSWCSTVMGESDVEHSHGICPWCSYLKFDGPMPEGARLTIWTDDRPGPRVYFGVKHVNVSDYLTVMFEDDPQHSMQRPMAGVGRYELDSPTTLGK